MIAILDYGVGNLRSVLNLCHRVGAETCITQDPLLLAKADRLILPGVGHFGAAMERLRSSPCLPVLTQRVLENRVPLLGLCVGMQILARRSEEGNCEGLGWIDAEVKRFHLEDHSKKLRVPHVGFNTVTLGTSPLFRHAKSDWRFYFTHSYHMVSENRAQVIGETDHGYRFVSIVQRENIFGTQFHPEKSHHAGIDLMQGFLEVTK